VQAAPFIVNYLFNRSRSAGVGLCIGLVSGAVQHSTAQYTQYSTVQYSTVLAAPVRFCTYHYAAATFYNQGLFVGLPFMGCGAAQALLAALLVLPLPPDTRGMRLADQDSRSLQ
jgi:hypothetical protein